MRFSKILLSSLLIISLVSCEESTTIGSSIIEDEIEIVEANVETNAETEIHTHVDVRL